MREGQDCRCHLLVPINISIDGNLQKCKTRFVETLQPRTMTRPMLQMERRMGRPLADVLTDLYHQEGLTLAGVAERIGVSVNTVIRWMDALDIETRFPGQRGKATADPAA